MSLEQSTINRLTGDHYLLALELYKAFGYNVTTGKAEPTHTPKATYRSDTRQALFHLYSFANETWVVVIQCGNGDVGRMPKPNNAAMIVTKWKMPRTGQYAREMINLFFDDVDWFVNNGTIPPARLVERVA